MNFIEAYKVRALSSISQLEMEAEQLRSVEGRDRLCRREIFGIEIPIIVNDQTDA